MMLGLAAQGLAAGVVNGFVYALIGIGIAVIFKGSGIVNAMQGELAVLSAVVTVVSLESVGLPYPAAIAVGVISGTASSAILERLLVSRLVRRGAGHESFLLLTIGIAYTLSAMVLYFFGREDHLLPAWADGALEFGEVVVLGHSIVLVAVSLALVIALRVFYARTLLGLSMAAASLDPDGASTTGINVGAMRTATFALGGALAAVAGVLVTPLIGVGYAMGPGLTLKGFAAAVFGGLTNPMGAMLGGLVIGVAEALAAVGISSGYKDVFALGIMVAIMIWRPAGLLAKRERLGG